MLFDWRKVLNFVSMVLLFISTITYYVERFWRRLKDLYADAASYVMQFKSVILVSINFVGYYMARLYEHLVNGFLMFHGKYRVSSERTDSGYDREVPNKESGNEFDPLPSIEGKLMMDVDTGLEKMNCQPDTALNVKIESIPDDYNSLGLRHECDSVPKTKAESTVDEDQADRSSFEENAECDCMYDGNEDQPDFVEGKEDSVVNIAVGSKVVDDTDDQSGLELKSAYQPVSNKEPERTETESGTGDAVEELNPVGEMCHLIDTWFQFCEYDELMTHLENDFVTKDKNFALGDFCYENIATVPEYDANSYFVSSMNCENPDGGEGTFGNEMPWTDYDTLESEIPEPFSKTKISPKLSYISLGFSPDFENGTKNEEFHEIENKRKIASVSKLGGSGFYSPPQRHDMRRGSETDSLISDGEIKKKKSFKRRFLRLFCCCCKIQE